MHSAVLRRGFTLLELLVVVALIATISLSVMPVFITSMHGIQLRNARNDLIAAIRFAQEMAVRESVEYRVYFNSQEHSYRMVRLSGVNEKDEKQFEIAESLLGEKQFLPLYLEIERIKARKEPASQERYIACMPNGASSVAEIRLRDTRVRGNRFKITVEGPLGRVEMKDVR
jgi:prepilin-type N-terminal cleavage/methylation domain-containing protein